MSELVGRVIECALCTFVLAATHACVNCVHAEQVSKCTHGARAFACLKERERTRACLRERAYAGRKEGRERIDIPRIDIFKYIQVYLYLSEGVVACRFQLASFHKETAAREAFAQREVPKAIPTLAHERPWLLDQGLGLLCAPFTDTGCCHHPHQQKRAASLSIRGVPPFMDVSIRSAEDEGWFRSARGWCSR